MTKKRGSEREGEEVTVVLLLQRQEEEGQGWRTARSDKKKYAEKAEGAQSTAVGCSLSPFPYAI